MNGSQRVEGAHVAPQAATWEAGRILLELQRAGPDR